VRSGDRASPPLQFPQARGVKLLACFCFKHRVDLNQTVSNAVAKLQQLGILEDYPFEAAQRTYIAADIFGILTRR
jgi:hypothetical protein